jgi:Flp pilus assembly pilin Flp
MRTSIRFVIMVAVALVAIAATQTAASAATAIEYGLIAALIACV